MSILRVGLVASSIGLLLACAAAPAEESSSSSDAIGEASLTIGALGTDVEHTVLIGPQKTGKVPYPYDFTCRRDGSTSTVDAPYAWVKVSNPKNETALVSLWTEQASGGPYMRTRMWRYESSTKPVDAELGACVAFTDRCDASPCQGSQWSAFAHADGRPLEIAPNSAAYVLVASFDATGALRLRARTERVFRSVGVAKLVLPAEGKDTVAEVAFASSVVGKVPYPYDFRCTSQPVSTIEAPYVWIDVENASGKIAVASLWTEQGAGGPYLRTRLYQYASEKKPSDDKLGACVATSDRCDASPCQGSQWAAFAHADGRPLMLEPGKHAYVLATASGGTGVANLRLRTDLLQQP